MGLKEKFESSFPHQLKYGAPRGIYKNAVEKYCREHYSRLNFEVIPLKDESAILFENYPCFYPLIDIANKISHQLTNHWCGLFYKKDRIDFVIEGRIKSQAHALEVKEEFKGLKRRKFLSNTRVEKKGNYIRLHFSFNFLNYLENEINGGTVYKKIDLGLRRR